MKKKTKNDEVLIGISCDDCGEIAYFASPSGFVSGKIVCVKCSVDYHKKIEGD